MDQKNYNSYCCNKIYKRKYNFKQNEQAKHRINRFCFPLLPNYKLKNDHFLSSFTIELGLRVVMRAVEPDNFPALVGTGGRPAIQVLPTSAHPVSRR